MTRAVGGARGRTRAAAARAVVARVARDLGVARWRTWPGAECEAFERLALVLAPVEDLCLWPGARRRRLVRLLRLRGRASEADYLRGLRRERRLARALSRLIGAGHVAGARVRRMRV